MHLDFPHLLYIFSAPLLWLSTCECGLDEDIKPRIKILEQGCRHDCSSVDRAIMSSVVSTSRALCSYRLSGSGVLSSQDRKHDLCLEWFRWQVNVTWMALSPQFELLGNDHWYSEPYMFPVPYSYDIKVLSWSVTPICEGQHNARYNIFQPFWGRNH